MSQPGFPTAAPGMPVGAAGRRTQPQHLPCPWQEECPLLGYLLWTVHIPGNLWKDRTALSLLQCTHGGLTGVSTCRGSQASNIPIPGDTECPSPRLGPSCTGTCSERGEMRTSNPWQLHCHKSPPFPQLGASTARSAGSPVIAGPSQSPATLRNAGAEG